MSDGTFAFAALLHLIIVTEFGCFYGNVGHPWLKWWRWRRHRTDLLHRTHSPTYRAQPRKTLIKYRTDWYSLEYPPKQKLVMVSISLNWHSFVTVQYFSCLCVFGTRSISAIVVANYLQLYTQFFPSSKALPIWFVGHVLWFLACHSRFISREKCSFVHFASNWPICLLSPDLLKWVIDWIDRTHIHTWKHWQCL